MKKAEFIDLVTDEINHIKSVATPEEISRLSINKFSHFQSDRCIYGLMTGHCNSARAKELMKKSFCDIPSWSTFISFNDQPHNQGEILTALEKYLFMVHKPIHHHIISYLKGEINELNIS